MFVLVCVPFLLDGYAFCLFVGHLVHELSHGLSLQLLLKA